MWRSRLHIKEVEMTALSTSQNGHQQGAVAGKLYSHPLTEATMLVLLPQVRQEKEHG